MSQTGFWRYETRLMAVLCLTFGFVFFDRNAMSYLGPFVQKDLNLSNTEVGALSSALSFAFALSALAVGYLSDKTGRDEIWVGEPDGKNLKAITNLDNEKGAFMFTPDSRALIYSAADKKLYSYAMADARTAVITSACCARTASPRSLVQDSLVLIMSRT